MQTLQKVKHADLTPEQQELADMLGLDIFLRLVEQCGGMNLYIPKAESVGRAVRNTAIRTEYTGYNIKPLAAKYRLSEVQIRSIIAQKDSSES